MEKYVELLKEYLGKQRHFTKTMFKVAGTIYRGVNSNRSTVEQALKKN